ncbi:MAG: hypothetical protein ACYCVB_18935 [Bacilli bacterium]
MTQVDSLTYVNGSLYAAWKGGAWVFQNGEWTQVTGIPQVDSLYNFDGTLYAVAGSMGGVWTYENDQWTQIQGIPYNDSVNQLQYFNGTLYAAVTVVTGNAFSRALLTYSSGHWSQMQGIPSNDMITGLAYANGKLYATVDVSPPGQGGFISQGAILVFSNGQWTPMAGIPANAEVDALQHVNGTLYAYMWWNNIPTGSVFAYNSGRWSQIPGVLNGLTSLLYANGTFYAGAANVGTMVYGDGKWNRLKGPGTPPLQYTIEALAYGNGALYVAAGTGFWKYQNHSWTQMKGAGIPTNGYTGQGQMQYANGVLYITRGSDLIWTYSNGKWLHGLVIPTGESVTALQYANGALYASAGSYIWEYKKLHWMRLIGGVPSWRGSITHFLYADGAFYVVVSNQDELGEDEVWEYTKKKWIRLSGIPAADNVTTLQYVNGVLYAGTTHDGVLACRIRSNG